MKYANSYVPTRLTFVRALKMNDNNQVYGEHVPVIHSLLVRELFAGIPAFVRENREKKN